MDSISFAGQMVRAVLERRKIKTRRLRKFKLGHKYMRENYALHAKFDHLKPIDIPPQSRIHYLADGLKPDWAGKTRPSIFMPEWASRTTIDVIQVIQVPLIDISEEDAQDEGFDDIQSFRNFWNILNGKKHPWNSNPLIWVHSLYLI